MNVKRLLLVAFCGGVAMSAAEPFGVKTVVRDAGSSVSQYLVALPHIAYGGGFRTKIIIRNTASAAADVTLNYFAFGPGGALLGVPIAGVVTDHTTVTVPPNGTREVEPDWQGPVAVGGWVGFVYANTGVKIQGVFLWHNPADPADKYTEAAAPVVSQAGAACIIPLPSGSSTMTMPYDETEGRFSGYGFANTTNAAVTMSLTFYDQDGATVSQYTQSFAAFAHDQFLLRDKAPALANKKGLMQISGQGIVPLGFRYTPYFTFTTWLP